MSTSSNQATDLYGPAADPARRRWTRAEYYRMGESGLLSGQRTELVGGEVIVLNPQRHLHAVTVDLVAEILRNLVGSNYWVRMQLPLACSDESEPEPDVCVVGGRRNSYSDHPMTATLVVEVSDTTLQFDREVKSSLYARSCVAEYWILNLNERILEVYRHPLPDSSQPYGYRYQDVSLLAPEDSVTPTEPPQASIRVGDLFP